MIRLVALSVLAVANMAHAQSEPRALFTIAPADPETGEEVTFDATLSFERIAGGGSLVSWEWSFGGECEGGFRDRLSCTDDDDCQDGSCINVETAVGVVATFTYDQPGFHTVGLVVTDSNGVEGTTSRTFIVVLAASNTGGEVVNLLPTAEFTMSTTQSAVGDEVSFDASDSSDEDGDKECATSGDACDGDADCDVDEACLDMLQYAWDFGDGTTQGFSTDPETAHTFSEEGDYEVRLFVCDQATCSADTEVSESFQQIEVLAAGTNLAPTAIVASGPRNATVGESLSFDGQLSFDPNGDQLDFMWDVEFSGFSIDTVLTPVMTRSFDLVGTYTITLEVSDGRGGKDDAVPFTVAITEAPPVIEPPAASPTPGAILEDPVDSALQRPTALTPCGVAMIPAMFASMLGMLAMGATRRRWSH